MTPSQIVRRFGVEPRAIRRMNARDSVHWVVQSDHSRYVLRRYGSHYRDRSSAEWEVRVLRHLADRKWPVAVPVGDFVEDDGKLYALFPYIGGPRTKDPRDAWRQCGRTLARLHKDLSQIHVGQRSGWSDTFELSRASARRHPLLDRLRGMDAEVAKAAEAFADDAESRLPALAHVPRVVIHSDFAPWNLRFARGKLTAVYDFELSRVDARAADVAWMRRGFHDDAVAGYLEVASLSDAELEALHLMWTTWVLDWVWDVLARPDRGVEWMRWNFEQIRKTRPYG